MPGVQEAAGSGGTDRVHAEVKPHAVSDDNYLLSAGLFRL